MVGTHRAAIGAWRPRAFHRVGATPSGTEGATGTIRPVRIAAIDVGSNSVHMIVVDAEAGRGLRLVAREKDIVRLGDSAFADGHLSASSQARALSTIVRYLELAKRLEADAVVSAATSAVREAANGTSFLALVRKETGLHVSLLSGQEEARLIYLAVRDATD